MPIGWSDFFFFYLFLSNNLSGDRSLGVLSQYFISGAHLMFLAFILAVYLCLLVCFWLIDSRLCRLCSLVGVFPLWLRSLMFWSWAEVNPLCFYHGCCPVSLNGTPNASFLAAMCCNRNLPAFIAPHCTSIWNAVHYCNACYCAYRFSQQLEAWHLN